MFCTKCKFNSFDHLSKCPKCGFDWSEARDALQLTWLQSAGFDWFQHARPRTDPDDRDALSADANPDSVFFADHSASAAQPSENPDAPRSGSLHLEEVTLKNGPPRSGENDRS